MLRYLQMWLLLEFALHGQYFVRSLDLKDTILGLRNISRNRIKPHLAIFTTMDGMLRNESSGKHFNPERIISTPEGKVSNLIKETRGRRNAADFILQWKYDTNTTATLYAYKLHGRQNCCFNSTKPYDSKGAMYFAIAVILFYGISIALLVAASTLKRSRTDYELKGFLRSYARIEEEKRTREKQLVRTVLQQRNLLHLWPGSSHRSSFLTRLAHTESLRRASRTSACSIATSKKSSIDKTSLLEAITEERRRASFPEKRVTLSDQGEPAYSKQRGLCKTMSCAEVVAAGVEKMMEGDVLKNGKLVIASPPVINREVLTVVPKAKNKFHSLMGRSNTDSSQRSQQDNNNQSCSSQRSKHKKILPQTSMVLVNLPVVTVELFEDPKEATENRKVEVQDDLVLPGSIKIIHRRSSEICFKNIIGS